MRTHLNRYHWPKQKTKNKKSGRHSQHASLEEHGQVGVHAQAAELVHVPRGTQLQPLARYPFGGQDALARSRGHHLSEN